MINNGIIKEIQERHGRMVDLDLSIKASNMTSKEADDVLDAFAEFTFRVTAPDTPTSVPDLTKKIQRDFEKALEIPEGIIPTDDCPHFEPKTSPDMRHLQPSRNGGNPAHKDGGNKKEGNRFGIPHGLHSNDKKKYDRLWHYCNKHNITYEEALERQKNKEIKKKTGRKPLSTSKKPADIPETPPAPADDIPAAPEETVPYPGEKKLRQISEPVNTGLTVGDYVKHNGSKGSPHYGQVGQVLGINKELLRIKFPTGEARIPQYLVLRCAAETKPSGP